VTTVRFLCSARAPVSPFTNRGHSPLSPSPPILAATTPRAVAARRTVAQDMPAAFDSASIRFTDMRPSARRSRKNSTAISRLGELRGAVSPACSTSFRSSRADPSRAYAAPLKPSGAGKRRSGSAKLTMPRARSAGCRRRRRFTHAEGVSWRANLTG
jgi:hypothetical protein